MKRQDGENSSESLVPKRARRNQELAFAEDFAEIATAVAAQERHQEEVTIEQNLENEQEPNLINISHQEIRNQMVTLPHVVEDDSSQSPRSGIDTGTSNNEEDEDSLIGRVWLSAPSGRREPRVGSSFQVGILPPLEHLN